MFKLEFCVIATLVLLVSSLCSAAQEATPGEQFVSQKYNALNSMSASINYLVSQINAKNKEIKDEQDENEKTKIRSEIAGLTRKLNTIKMSFANVIGDENLFFDEEEDLSKQKVRDITKELQDLLIPFIDSIKNATKKPRKIEKLRYDIELTDQKIILGEKAIRNIEKIESIKQLDSIKSNIESSKQMIQKYIDENKVLKNIYINVLNKELGTKTSLILAASNTIKKFFSTKGINLLIALSFGTFVFLVLIWLKKKLQSLQSFIINEQKKINKTVNALYSVLTGIISIVTGIAVLFILNDWFLFTLAVLVSIGGIWSLKKYFPKFLSEIKIILNLGSVKEGERIVWNNCPWIVKKLGMVVHLENEYLDTSITSIPIHEVVNLHSRPILQEEKLFPSRPGDFVMLSNSVYGQVKIQTYEHVVISISPTLQITYPVQEYFSLKPLNYSNGFQLNMVLSIDYKHQKEIFKLIDTIKEELLTLILNNTQFPKSCFNNIIVELKEPSTLSLDLFVYVDCTGELAPVCMNVRRFLNAMLVTICNGYDISINFGKLTNLRISSN